MGASPPREREHGTSLRAPVAITGMGAVSALGDGVEALWAALLAGRDGIRPVDRFSVEELSVRTAALVAVEKLGLRIAGASAPLEVQDLAIELAVRAAAEAIAAARLEDRGLLAEQNTVALVVGTSLASHAEGVHRIAELVGEALNLRGVRLTISTACASSTDAVGVGRDLLLRGEASAVLAGGTDILTEEIFAGFHNLGLLAPNKCAPFSEPPGTTLGEGAGFVVLEAHAPPGHPPLAWVSGSGLSCDAFHATSPDPSGAGVARAIRAALADAGVGPDAIDYVNAHGTGTAANDPAEWRGITSALGSRAGAIPVSATKSALGHAQGAAGILEIIATVRAMAAGSVPQTLSHTTSRPRCPADPVAQAAPRPHPVRHALANSAAFGGANAIAVLDAPAHAAPARAVRASDVWLAGAAAVLPAPAPQDLDERLFAEPPSGRVDLAALDPRAVSADLRGFDPTSLLMTHAVSAALRDAGILSRGADRARDRLGIFSALTRPSPASTRALRQSIDERGLLRLSAPAFTRVVLNAAAGAVARALHLRGPTTTISTGAGGGLAALVLGAAHLAFRDDADAIAVAAADEAHEEPGAFCEAGACLVLTRAPSPRALRVAGFAFGPPQQWERAVEAATSRARMTGADIDRALRLDAGALGSWGACFPLLAAMAALPALRRRDSAHVILSHANESTAAAIVLAAEGGTS